MNPVEALCKTFNSRMEAVSGASAIDNAEFGIITADYGLKLERFSQAIPNGDFMVSKRLLKWDEITVKTEETEGHRHTVKINADQTQQGLNPGDHVLVIWVGNEPVITDVVLNSKILR